MKTSGAGGTDSPTSNPVGWAEGPAPASNPDRWRDEATADHTPKPSPDESETKADEEGTPIKADPVRANEYQAEIEALDILLGTLKTKKTGALYLELLLLSNNIKNKGHAQKTFSEIKKALTRLTKSLHNFDDVRLFAPEDDEILAYAQTRPWFESTGCGKAAGVGEMEVTIWALEQGRRGWTYGGNTAKSKARRVVDWRKHLNAHALKGYLNPEADEKRERSVHASRARYGVEDAVAQTDAALAILRNRRRDSNGTGAILLPDGPRN